MEAKELRLGNYIRYRDERNVVVQSLGYRFHTGRPHDLQIVGSEDIDEYEPIPITELWLKEFGFKDDRGKFTLDAGEINFFTIKQTLPKGSWMIPEYNVFGLMYVHQLQNLFYSLTGKELTK
nr:hypothetical protein [uncultured Allomuricauda sp.]